MGRPQGRVFFLGAGASKQDGYPLTGELRHGIAWAIQKEQERFRSLRSHLEHLYYVDEGVLGRSVETWNRLKDGKTDAAPPGGRQVPDVTDLLSTIDWMIREQSTFGPDPDAGRPPNTPLPMQLAAVRDQVVQALCLCLGLYGVKQSASATKQLMERVCADDSLITTNWDLYLDAARHEKFGSAALDYGTVGNVLLEEHETARCETRPQLLKLHGSLSWRYCQRCQRLVIDPFNYVAGDRKTPSARCDCTCRYSELIVTPGFVREYRNVHLLNIWRYALEALALAAEWVFIGYSLPADDVGIRALLMKARCMHEDIFGSPTRVTVVSGDDRAAVGGRYSSILEQVDTYPGDFATYVS